MEWATGAVDRESPYERGCWASLGAGEGRRAASGWQMASGSGRCSAALAEAPNQKIPRKFP